MSGGGTGALREGLVVEVSNQGILREERCPEATHVVAEAEIADSTRSELRCKLPSTDVGSRVCAKIAIFRVLPERVPLPVMEGREDHIHASRALTEESFKLAALFDLDRVLDRIGT
jgi:hypothetical protein